jgi:hypothetical protein
MMNKWVWRMIGIVMLLLFMMMFAQMHSQLRRIQQQQMNEPARK